MQKHFKTLVSGLAVFGALAVALTVQAAWSAPAPGTIPPDNNAAAPINVGATAQTKTGSLTVDPSTGVGVYGHSPDTWSGYFTGLYGIYGASTGAGFGVQGYSPTSLGVFGSSGSYYGVQGNSASHHGVRGANTGNNTWGGYFDGGGGVYGEGRSASIPGVYGYNASYVGVQGISVSNHGVYGVSTNSNGVNGVSTNTSGGHFVGAYGLYALDSGSGVYARLGYNSYTLYGNGSAMASSFLYFSDARLKDNVVPIKDALTKVLALSGNTFTWKEGERKGESDVGLIAQEVEKIAPELVSTDETTGYKQVDYPRVVPLLVEAVKEQQRQIDELKSALDSLR